MKIYPKIRRLHLSEFLNIGKSHVVEAIGNLKKAQCIDAIQHRGDKGNYYNLYSQQRVQDS